MKRLFDRLSRLRTLETDVVMPCAEEALHRERLHGSSYHEWRWAMCHVDDLAQNDRAASLNRKQRGGQGPLSGKGV